jgi:hypothetical protein
MGKTKLYIIGNGFDLHHEIRSAYSDFKVFLKKGDWILFRLVEDYLPVGKEWNELEIALGDIDVTYMADRNDIFCPSHSEMTSDSGHHDFQYEIGKTVTNLSSTLRAQLKDWVRQIEIPDATSAKNRLSTLDINGLYLTFNYTSTLTSVYSVPAVNILHIHGEAALPDTDLVLGHASNPNDRKSLNDHSGVEDQDTRVTEAYDILDGYFSATFKPSEKIIQKNAPFFAGLRNIEEVFVLGHSLSDVDLNYFAAVVKAIDIDAVRWSIACRDSEEMEDKHAKIAMLGVPAHLIKTVLLNAL